jgi:hypothetical protein
MSWAIVVGAGVSLAGAYVNNQSGKSAAKGQLKAADNATLAQLQALAQSRADLAPWRGTGMKALDELNNQMGLGRASLLSYDDWLKANPNISAQAQPGAVNGTTSHPDMLKTVFQTYPRKLASIGDVLHLDPFGFGKKKKKKAKQQAAQVDAQATATDQAQHSAYDAYVTDFNNTRAEDPGVAGDLNRDFTLADFTKDPGYEFRLAEGEKGRERAAAARGGLVSGAQLKELDRYDQDYASGEFSNAYNRFNNDRTNRFNRLSSLAGLGTTATSQLINTNQSTANNVSELSQQVGNINAARDINRGNAESDALTSLGNFYLQQRYRPMSGVPGGGRTMTPPYAMNTSNFQYNDTGSGGGSYV